MRTRILALTLAACSASAGTDDADTDADLPPVDPDVNSVLAYDALPEGATRLVYLGDSITAGAGASKASLTYTSLLQENAAKWTGYDAVDLETSVPTIDEVIDVSRGGATTDTLLAQQIPALDAELGELPAEGGTVVVFTIGGNDAQLALNPLADAAEVVDQILANFEAIFTELTDEERFAGPVWVHATNVYEPTDGTGQVDDCFFGIDFSSKLGELERANEELAEMSATYGVSIVDLRGHFLGHGMNNKNPAAPSYDEDDSSRWFDSDCIHPNDRGHHEIRRLFHASISGEPLRVEE